MKTPKAKRTQERLAAIEEQILEEMNQASVLRTSRRTINGLRHIEAHFILDYALEEHLRFRTRLLVEVGVGPHAGFCTARIQGLDLNLSQVSAPQTPSPDYVQEINRRAEQLFPLVERWDITASSLQGQGPLPVGLLQALQERRLLIQQHKQRIEGMLTQVTEVMADQLQEVV